MARPVNAFGRYWLSSDPSFAKTQFDMQVFLIPMQAENLKKKLPWLQGDQHEAPFPPYEEEGSGRKRLHLQQPSLGGSKWNKNVRLNLCMLD